MMPVLPGVAESRYISQDILQDTTYTYYDTLNSSRSRVSYYYYYYGGYSSKRYYYNESYEKGYTNTKLETYSGGYYYYDNYYTYYGYYAIYATDERWNTYYSASGRYQSKRYYYRYIEDYTNYYKVNYKSTKYYYYINYYYYDSVVYYGYYKPYVYMYYEYYTKRTVYRYYYYYYYQTQTGGSQYYDRIYIN